MNAKRLNCSNTIAHKLFTNVHYLRRLTLQKPLKNLKEKENFHFHQGVRENVRAKFSVHCHKLRNSKAPEKLQGSTILLWPLKMFTLDFPNTKDPEYWKNWGTKDLQLDFQSVFNKKPSEKNYVNSFFFNMPNSHFVVWHKLINLVAKNRRRPNQHWIVHVPLSGCINIVYSKNIVCFCK